MLANRARHLHTCQLTTSSEFHLLLQDLALRCLRVSKVHHLVQQFVNDDKVIPNTLLLEDLEVFGEDLHELVEEEKNFGGICVSFGQSENVQVAVTDIKVLEIRTGLCQFHVDAHTQSGGQGCGIDMREEAEQAAKRTLTPSWEKQGGTADDSSSASLRRTGNFSTADMGISPR